MKTFSAMLGRERIGRLRPLLLPVLILALGLATTAWLWSMAREDVREQRAQEVEWLAGKFAGLIEERFRDNVQLLRGAAGLFDVPEWITRERFHRYFQTLRLEDQYPGIQGIGFLLLIPEDQKDARVAAVQREGFPSFQIHPDGERGFYAAVLYIERLSGRNLRTLGYDMAAEPLRWAAAMRARDQAAAALSARVTLQQEGATDIQPGVVLFLPVYRAGAPHAGVAERRANLLGWVYSPLRMHDLMQDVLRPVQSDLAQPGVRLAVYDGDRPAPETLLFTSAPAAVDPTADGAVHGVELLEFAGHQWSLVVTADPAFTPALGSRLAAWIGLGGLTVSLLLTLIAAVQTQARRRVGLAMAALGRTNRHLAEQERTVISICTPHRDARGKVVRLSGTLQDITERAELQSRIQKIATHVPGAIYQYQQWPDGHGAFPYASAGITDIYGVEPAEVATDATAVFDRLHPDDRARVEAGIAASMRSLGTWHDSYRVRLPGGRVIWVEGEASPEAQADGSVRWHGYLREVTARRQAEEQRRNLQKMLARTEQIAHIGSWEWDVAKDRVTWSEELFRIFQLDPSAGAPAFAEHHRLYGPDDLARLQTAVATAVNQGIPFVVQLVARRPDGSTRVCLSRGYPEIGPNHEVTHLYGSFQDITEQNQAERDLRLAASVFANSSEAILITDADNRIIDTNPAFSAVTGYARADVLGKDPTILASGRHDAAFFRAMWYGIKRRGAWRGEIWNRRQDGEPYAALLSISVVRDVEQRVQNYIGIFSDISELKAHEAELDRLANFDPLTGLPNRRLLGDRLEQAIAGSRRSDSQIAVCYLDLDEFKPINDRYGHAVGDQVLISIANQLRKELRAQDTVARLGGDEFVLLFNDLARLEDSQLLLERVLAACARPIVLNGVTHRVSASIGVTLSPPDIANADSLLRHADQAMYHAKEAGRNRYHFSDAEQDQRIHDRRLQLQGIRNALTNQEFVLFYQPKVNMVSRQVIGVEALIRWQHPDAGLLLPGAFLPMIEGSDLEIGIGEWVIAAALTQIATWQGQGLRLPVSVNISAGHLLQPSFAQRLEQLLAEHPERAPGVLELEILETSALSDVERAGETLTACQALGVRVALDDFGTGYSSLTYFRRLPIDVLKIDQSFVRDMLDDPDDMEIVESVVRLAHAFNRSVVAEGVETPEHGALLNLLDCPLGQGFGIARPMPADAVPSWVSTWPEQGTGMVVDHGISKPDIPLFMAIQNHRHWVDEFVSALNDMDIARLAEIDSTPCRFERWYHGSGSTRYGTLEGFPAVGRHHVKVHALASAITGLAEQGEITSARERLPSLLAARDALTNQLRALAEGLKTAGE